MKSIRLHSLAVAAIVTACAEPSTPTAPVGETPSAANVATGRRFVAAFRTGAPVDIPAVAMDLPPQRRPWDDNNAALEQAVAAGDGHAIIAFKETGKGKVRRSNGVRAAVTAGTINAGLALLRARGVEIVTYLDAIGAAHVRLAPGIASVLAEHPLIDYIEPRQMGSVLGVRLAPRSTLAMFDQTTPWGMDLIRAPEAWAVTTGGSVPVEIIDTGHQQDHEDLPAVPTANCAGAQSGCDDSVLPHGTHVTGIALARDNGIGVIGVANGIPGSSVYEYGACNDAGGCASIDVTAGINSAVWTAKVINLSLRQDYDLAQSNAVAQAWGNDIVIVAAAGNNGGNTVIYPANYSNVVGVSGILPTRAFASTSPCGGASSNWGSHVDISAPFYALSTVYFNSYGDENQGWCGTSMATPHVTGVAALIRAWQPSWTNSQVVNQLLTTALDPGAPGRDDFFGYGIVDAARAVGLSAPPGPPTASIAPPSSVRANQPCLWTASYSGGIAPLTTMWIKNGTPIEYNTNEVTTSFSSSGTLQFQVTDAINRVYVATKNITVSPSAPICLF